MTGRLTDRIPLRTMESIGLTGADFIPIIYGSATVTALPMGTHGEQWVICDHVLRADAIQNVQIDGASTGGYALRQYPTEAGGAISVIHMAGRYPGATVTVHTRNGRIDARNGIEITNPADIMRDVITVVAGINIPAARWGALRQETREAGLQCVGVVGDGNESTKHIVDAIAASVGMIWSPSMLRIGMLLPPSHKAPAVKLTEREILTLTARSVLRDSVGEIRYHHQDSAGQDRAHSRITGVQGVVRDIFSAWVQSPRIASSVVDRIAQTMESMQWRLVCTIPPHAPPRIGDKVEVNHPYSPISAGLVLGVEETVEKVTLLVAG